MTQRMRVWFSQPEDQPETEPDFAQFDGSGESSVVINFGNNVFTGANIVFGNVSSGSIIQNVTLAPVGEAGLADHETEEHLHALAAIHAERRDLLIQQIERFGDHAPAHLSLEVNHIERQLADIESKLARCAGAAE